MATVEAFKDLLACPGCKSPVRIENDRVTCSNADCGAAFPVVEGRPALIWSKRSLFDTETISWDACAQRKDSRRWLSRFLPTLDGNQTRRRNYRRLIEMIREIGGRPRVLSLEVSRRGDGAEQLRACSELQLLTANITLQEHVGVLADGHDLPFLDQSFDAVVGHAVLDHVIDPRRVLGEIHRVLKPSGIVYVEAPFLQPVHLGRHDYLRFTLMGVRSLLRDFEIVEQGVGCGPGMALGMVYTSFLQSFFRSPRLQRAAFTFGRLTGFWFKYFDYYLRNNPSGMDAAAGSYFIGRRGERSLSDREVAENYRGAQAADPFATAQAASS